MKKRDSIEYYDTHWSNERAYKNGYAKGYGKGYADAILYAKEELKKISQEVEQIHKAVKEMAGADNERKAD